MLLPSDTKLKLLLVGLLSIGFFSGCQSSSSNLYSYDFQTAKITYKISGSSQGTSEVLIKGDKKVIKTHIIQTTPNQSESESYTIQNGEKQYILDSKGKTGQFFVNPFYKELSGLSPEKRKNRMIEEATRSEAGNTPVSEGQESIAGQQCDLYTASISKICLWQGIPLKSVASLPDYGIQTETLATKIELNIPIDDSEFDLPSDYKITSLQ